MRKIFVLTIFYLCANFDGQCQKVYKTDDVELNIAGLSPELTKLFISQKSSILNYLNKSLFRTQSDKVKITVNYKNGVGFLKVYVDYETENAFYDSFQKECDLCEKVYQQPCIGLSSIKLYWFSILIDYQKNIAKLILQEKKDVSLSNQIMSLMLAVKIYKSNGKWIEFYGIVGDELYIDSTASIKYDFNKPPVNFISTNDIKQHNPKFLLDPSPALDGSIVIHKYVAEFFKSRNSLANPLVNSSLTSEINDEVPNIDIDQEIKTDVLEDIPEFEGGAAAMYRFIQKNMVYPKKASKLGINGKVTVCFDVNSNGEVKNVKVIQGIGGGCDEEAIRIISSMPKWKAGKQNIFKKIITMNFKMD